MATVYRKKIIRPMPKGAEIVAQRGKQLACWRDGRDRKRTAEIAVGRDGVVRIATRTATYYARYRDANGQMRDLATGCRDETAARAVLADLVRRSELVKAGVITPTEDAIASHQDVRLAEHVEAWLAHLEAKDVTKGRIKTNRQRFTQVAKDCRFARLTDLDGGQLEKWMLRMATEGMSAGSRNGYREACVGFGNWAVRAKRLGENPFAYVPKADAKSDCRRKRRALSEEELVRLLDAARRRPLLEAMTIRRGRHKGEPLAEVKPQRREQLERLGRERALIYKTLVLTGLRRNELASITVGQVELDGPHPHAVLHPSDEKNRQGSTIPLRADLVAEIREWLAGKLLLVQREAIRQGHRPSAGHSTVRGSHRAGEDPQPRLEAGRDSKEGQPGLDHRRPRHAAYVRHAAEQRQRRTAHSPGGHAALVDRSDDERLHRPEAAGRRRRSHRPARASARHTARPQTSAASSHRHR